MWAEVAHLLRRPRRGVDARPQRLLASGGPASFAWPEFARTAPRWPALARGRRSAALGSALFGGTSLLGAADPS
jgi:hypothetical protein